MFPQFVEIGFRRRPGFMDGGSVGEEEGGAATMETKLLLKGKEKC